ncbi:MAG: RluA family pseudouridine synthase [Planctomycetaceae bacterium]|nr:RluA family pseudouridine synthase [Planctomycetaceae bacterium]
MEFPYIAKCVVERYLSGVRIDTFLAKRFRSYTSWRMHRMVRAGQAWVNGEPAEPARRVYTGQEVTIRLIDPPDDLMPAENIPLGVVYEDDALLVVNKPAGLIVHPCGERPRGTLTNAVQWHVDRTSPLKGLLKPGVVHRLDRDTSGLIAIAKEHLSHRLLSMQFQAGDVSKAYIALVDGVLGDDIGLIDRPIGRVPGCSSALMTSAPNALEARQSQTAFEVLERYPRHSLVKAFPKTGRLHQIRVHLASLGHPVVGDEYYAAFGELKPPRPPLLPDGTRPGPPISPLIPRHALHATLLAFVHPITNRTMEFTADIPKDMRAAIELVRE